jgi:hypothetical protein
MIALIKSVKYLFFYKGIKSIPKDQDFILIRHRSYLNRSIADRLAAEMDFSFFQAANLKG